MCSQHAEESDFWRASRSDGLSPTVPTPGFPRPSGGVAGTTAVLGERETVRTAIAAVRPVSHWAASGNGTRQQPADWPRPATAGTHAHGPLRFLPARALPTTPPPQSVRVNKGSDAAAEFTEPVHITVKSDGTDNNNKQTSSVFHYL